MGTWAAGGFLGWDGTFGAKFTVCRQLRPMKIPAETVSFLFKNGDLARR